jgi:hypothetical protein
MTHVIVMDFFELWWLIYCFFKNYIYVLGNNYLEYYNFITFLYLETSLNCVEFVI